MLQCSPLDNRLNLSGQLQGLVRQLSIRQHLLRRAYGDFIRAQLHLFMEACNHTVSLGQCHCIAAGRRAQGLRKLYGVDGRITVTHEATQYQHQVVGPLVDQGISSKAAGDVDTQGQPIGIVMEIHPQVVWPPG
ncbi:hypothetical protein D3C75_1096010 [compost metagenome]